MWECFDVYYNIFSSAMFTALSNSGVSALILLLRTFGLITALLLKLPRTLGMADVWLAVSDEELLALVMVLFLLRRQLTGFRE